MIIIQQFCDIWHLIFGLHNVVTQGLKASLYTILKIACDIFFGWIWLGLGGFWWFLGGFGLFWVVSLKFGWFWLGSGWFWLGSYFSKYGKSTLNILFKNQRKNF